jgi:hypothetical protein
LSVVRKWVCSLGVVPYHFSNVTLPDPANSVFGLEYDRKEEEQSLKYLLLRPFNARTAEEGIPESSVPTNQTENI